MLRRLIAFDVALAGVLLAAWLASLMSGRSAVLITCFSALISVCLLLGELTDGRAERSAKDR